DALSALYPYLMFKHVQLTCSHRKPLENLHSFYFNDTPTTEIYTLSLHDALPIYDQLEKLTQRMQEVHEIAVKEVERCGGESFYRSEEHTSELQSRENLVCRLLLEKKYGNRHGDHAVTVTGNRSFRT